MVARLPRLMVVAAVLLVGVTVGCSDGEDAQLSDRVTALEEQLSEAEAAAAGRSADLEQAHQQLAASDQEVRELEDQVGAAEVARDEAIAREEEMRRVLEDNLGAIAAEREAFVRELTQLRETAVLPDTPESRAAIAALTDFLDAMRAGRYAEAAALYAGDYDVVREWNPTVDPNDHEALLEAVCSQVLCHLEVRRVLPGLVEPDTYSFYLEFSEDGEPFSRGPCCGDDSEQPQTQFQFQVTRTADGFHVLTLPVYVP